MVVVGLDDDEVDDVEEVEDMDAEALGGNEG